MALRGGFTLLMGLALAAPAGATSWKPGPPPSVPPTSAAIETARQRYKKALQLYEQEGSAEASLVELQRAYDLAPNYRILFNIGQVARTAREYVVALAAFERYLADGGKELKADRRAEVEKELAELRGFVGRLDIAVNLPGAVVSVDDDNVGIAPLDGPVLVNGGRHRVVAVKDGAQASTLISVAGGDQTRVALEISRPAPVAKEEPRPAPVAPPPPRIDLTPPPEPPPSYRRGLPHYWIAWAATGLLAAGAATTGGLALAASSELKNESYVGDPDSGRVGELRGRISALAITTDVMLGAAAVSLGVSLYVTLVKVKVPAKVVAGPRGVFLEGSF